MAAYGCAISPWIEKAIHCLSKREPLPDTPEARIIEVLQQTTVYSQNAALLSDNKFMIKAIFTQAAINDYQCAEPSPSVYFSDLMRGGIVTIQEYSIQPWHDNIKDTWEHAVLVEQFTYLPGTNSIITNQDELIRVSNYSPFKAQLKKLWRHERLLKLLDLQRSDGAPVESLFSLIKGQHQFVFISEEEQMKLDQIPEFKDGYIPPPSLDASSPGHSWTSSGSVRQNLLSQFQPESRLLGRCDGTADDADAVDAEPCMEKQHSKDSDEALANIPLHEIEPRVDGAKGVEKTLEKTEEPAKIPGVTSLSKQPSKKQNLDIEGRQASMDDQVAPRSEDEQAGNFPSLDNQAVCPSQEPRQSIRRPEGIADSVNIEAICSGQGALSSLHSVQENNATSTDKTVTSKNTAVEKKRKTLTTQTDKSCKFLKNANGEKSSCTENVSANEVLTTQKCRAKPKCLF
ncbi:predicted protein [Nematostella vectensis]|uniref:Shelterin complex subunit TPP1/Est3 domain-containing protein n=2 Tax=Nematostella vectensis TaxID=45351 RepID=A7RRK2_NEMVE|nr:predicted protein [Nematostella vectensis]|eukprot:XP_001638082.1 predicted protein [Nematostella vectensis]